MKDPNSQKRVIPKTRVVKFRRRGISRGPSIQGVQALRGVVVTTTKGKGEEKLLGKVHRLRDRETATKTEGGSLYWEE